VGGELERVIDECKESKLLLIGDSVRVALYRTALRELGATAAAEAAAALPLADAIVAGQDRLLDFVQ
jgi:2-C-methyl-D-erythritol 4-phosphate cytidylyltransferase